MRARHGPKVAPDQDAGEPPMSFVFKLPLIVVGPGIILLLVAFGLGGLTLFRRFQLPKLRFGHSDAHFSGAMVASIMVFYGLALALTAVHVWETYEDVEKVVTREAACLAILWRDVSEYPEPTRQAEISYAVFCLKKKKKIKI